MLESFHPAVAAWFARRFPDGPTQAQAEGWVQIAAGQHTLIAAPTGSGKTLAAFLVCVDRIYRAHEAATRATRATGKDTGQGGGRGAPGANPRPRDGRGAPASGPDPAAGPQVIYVSPLKALAVDIWQNLELPLREIAETAEGLGLSAPDIRVAVRTGDTAAAQRAAMLKRPPDFLITTPESLYLLVTAERARAMLASAEVVIVDEIHAVAGNKRGSHLALTLERLEHLTATPLQRIGLSATSGRSRLSPGCWSAQGQNAALRTGRRAARSWMPGTAATSIWPWSSPTMSSARSPQPSRWPPSWT